MPPDLNSMPSSPRQDRLPRPSSPSPSTPAAQTVNRASRPPSQIMPPPPQPAPPQRQSWTPPPPPTTMLPNGTTGAATQHVGRGGSVTAGGGGDMAMPLRHPRPLTAAEVHEQMEKEQEALVNRLTRELTTLRAQSVSVASNASSSTSASMLPVDITDPNPTHQMVGPTHPTPSRRRGSSSVSSRGIQAPSSSSTAPSVAAAHAAVTPSVPIGGQSQASADRAAAVAGNTTSLSRQPSVTASGTTTPARQSLDMARPAQDHARGALYALPHRPSFSREQSHVSGSSQTLSLTFAQAGTPVSHPLPSPAYSPQQAISSPQYADTAAYRSEMDIVKAENEALRQRVRALERALLARRRDSSQSETPPRLDVPPAAAAASSSAFRTGREDARQAAAHANTGAVTAWAAADGGIGGVAGPRSRSESQSTTASSRRGVVPEDDAVRFGESAGTFAAGRSG